MIYLFAGDDSKKKIISYEKFMKSLPNGMETFFIGKNDFNQTQVESFYSGAGLFFNKCVVVFSDVLDREEVVSFVLEKLELMATSPNTFVFLEGKLKKPILDAFRKSRAELDILELPKEKKEKFDSFLLASALGNRDKLNLWIYFRQAMESGVSLEELIGILFWKAKDMILKKNFSKFSEQELQGFTSRIAVLLPEARKRGLDDESAFEQFLLEAF